MACIPIPKLPIPQLPSPLSIEPPSLPNISFDVELCCKIINFTIPLPPIPLPPLVLNLAGLNAIIAANIKSVQAYLDALPLDCPKELQDELAA